MQVYLRMSGEPPPRGIIERTSRVLSLIALYLQKSGLTTHPHDPYPVVARDPSLKETHVAHRTFAMTATPPRSQQTTIFAHFTPDRPSPRAGPSKTPNIARRQRSPSDSEGSEGMAGIQLSEDRQPWTSDAVPISQKRARKKAVYDSGNEDEEDDQDVAFQASPRRKDKKVVLRRPEKGDDPEGEISIPLQLGLEERDDAEDEDVIVVEEVGCPESNGVNNEDQDEILALPSPPPTASMDHEPLTIVTKAAKTRSDSIEELQEAIEVESELGGPAAMIGPEPRRSGRLKRGNPPAQSVQKATGSNAKSRSTRSNPVKKAEETVPNRKRRPLEPIRLPDGSSTRTSAPQLKKSSYKSPLPYIELPTYSPLELSAYKVWKIRDKPSPVLAVVSDPIDDGFELDILVSDTEDNIPLAIPSSSTIKKGPIERNTVAADASAAKISKKRPAPASSSSGSSSGLPNTSNPKKNTLGDVKRAKVLFQPSRRAEQEKGVSKPSDPSRTSGSISRQKFEKRQTKRGDITMKADSHKGRTDRGVHHTKHSKKRPEKARASKAGKLKKSARDPDDQDEAVTEDEGDMLEGLEIDEPERFKSKTRLRKKKENAFQRKLRKLKAHKLGIEESSSESESSSDGGRSHRTYTSDSATPTDDSLGTDDFIVDDGGEVQEGLLPHQFSSSSAQTPEFKFKVVFHYFVLLVVEGKNVLPLTGDTAEYLVPQLHDLRRKLQGFKNSRVRSQIWRADFVKALETYPNFRVELLDFPEDGCDACHMSGRRSKFRVFLEGFPYDRETHEPLDSSDEESEKPRKTGSNTQQNGRKRRGSSISSPSNSDDDSGDDSDDDSLPREFLMGKFCKRRAEVFHAMSHWEDQLYYRVRGYYRDLLRAKFKPVQSDSEASSEDTDPEEDPAEVKSRREDRERRRIVTQKRVKRLREAGGLVEQHRDVDKVTEWLDRKSYMTKDFRWFEELIKQSGMLEHDNSKDE